MHLTAPQHPRSPLAQQCHPLPVEINCGVANDWSKKKKKHRHGVKCRTLNVDLCVHFPPSPASPSQTARFTFPVRRLLPSSMGRSVCGTNPAVESWSFLDRTTKTGSSGDCGRKIAPQYHAGFRGMCVREWFFHCLFMQSRTDQAVLQWVPPPHGLITHDLCRAGAVVRGSKVISYRKCARWEVVATQKCESVLSCCTYCDGDAFVAAWICVDWDCNQRASVFVCRE